MKLLREALLYVWSAVQRVVILPLSIFVAMWGKATKVDKNWRHSTPGYKDYRDRPDYKRYQKARAVIGTGTILEKCLLKLKAI